MGTRKTPARRKYTKYSEALGNELCNLIHDGKKTEEIGRVRGMPAHSTIATWRRVHPEFNRAYLVALEGRGEYYADQVVDLSNSLAHCNDQARVNAIGKQIATNQWMAAKCYPKMFGNRQHIELEANVRSKPQEWDISALTKDERRTFHEILAKCTPIEDGVSGFR